MIDLLSEQARRVSDEVLGQEGARRRHLVVSLSGAHAYGFPSPDSDLDLKAIHVEATERLLSLDPPPPSASRMETIDGVEIDYSSNEIAPVLAGVLRGNGNYIERILGPIQLVTTSDLAELRPLVRAALSRRAHAHYRGFASGILREIQATEIVSAKSVLYVLRTTLTGAHLLGTGAVLTDLGVLAPSHGFPGAAELIAAKRAGERVALSPADRERWMEEIGRAFHRLDESLATSPLPDEAPNRAAIDAWLVALRRRGWDDVTQPRSASR